MPPPFGWFYFFKNPQKMVFEKIRFFEQLPGSKIPHLAIHKIISHIWEDRSRKVTNDEPDLRFFSRKLLTCYQPDSLKTLFFDLNPKGAKSVYPGPTHLGPPTWAQLGPTHLGPAWAHPLGPSLGPPTGAQLGPTHLGPDAAGRILKSRSRPLPTHPGMKYFREETLAVDKQF